jgi:hypothetical protein
MFVIVATGQPIAPRQLGFAIDSEIGIESDPDTDFDFDFGFGFDIDIW